VTRQDPQLGPSDDLVPVGTPIDLDNCAREPIHIPGSIQPRGVLAVVREADFQVLQVSANTAELLDRPVDEVLGRHLSALMGADQAARIVVATRVPGELRQRNPIECVLDVAGQRRAFDAILHREPGGVLLVELEIADGQRPFTFPNTYQAVRGSVEELNQVATLDELYGTAARAVRDLTGFDRVMVYRYDEHYNGEVVAESKRDDLNSFLGLHYPSTDIPAQARALYEKNWIRLISDVDYAPVPMVPTDDPERAAPLDLTYATLRSVSPIHVEYLQNMGVHAAMSISLLRNGRLWGLIACHHYAGPHLPPFGTRAAAEFLGSTLSLRLVERFDDDQLQKRLTAQAVLGKLTSATLDDSDSLTGALLGAPDLLDLVAAEGVVVNIAGEKEIRGSVPSPEVVSAVAAWALGAGDEIATTECISRDLPDLDVDPQLAAGALVLNLPDGHSAIWFRREKLRSVDWGGDPHNKAIAVSESDGVRLSPRKSFERWSEIVRQCSEPWTPGETESAEALRRYLVESLYRRTRGALRVAETLQRSLLPESIPKLENWLLSAHYEPAAGGRVGGDWYDAFELRDGRLIVLIGDVAGHGITAAGIMAQLRNVLRAQLFAGAAPAEALQQLNEFCLHMLPSAFATVLVARIDLDSGLVEAGCAGHLIPYLTSTSQPAVRAPIQLSPPIGVKGVSYKPSVFTLEPGHGLVIYSDGLVERRGESIDDNMDRLAEAVGHASHASASWIRRVTSENTHDDVTIVTLHRP
jgi:chemotaxis family two-component system sensor kinase Cph1